MLLCCLVVTILTVDIMNHDDTAFPLHQKYAQTNCNCLTGLLPHAAVSGQLTKRKLYTGGDIAR